ncbi:Protein of unknown function [Cotesia congregata]|uniref:Uncharacterized protein n=1 Tax=Cotesia congregata TaxID=51543 RepID=A0A8J2ELW0_COTCN|nr:Protein of unknown function [Cotesia congregata]
MVISEWCAKNKLNLNCNKTKAVIFGTPHRVAELESVSVPCIAVDSNVIGYYKSVKYLGVILENTLTWSLQFTNMCNKSMRTLAQLKMNGGIFNLQLRKKLVSTLIFPIFDYCAAIYTDNTRQYYKDLHWLTLKTRREFFLACFIYKALHVNQKPLIGKDLRVLESRLRRGDGCQDLLMIPFCHSAKYDKSFLVSAVRVCNRLPEYYTSQPTFLNFRKSCYEYLFSSEGS